jgi:quinolinate synthase
MVLWNGLCPTHLRITPDLLRAARKAHPGAEVLIHPEATHECRELADAVLSTGGMCDYAAASSGSEFIIATESGLLHTLRKQNPGKSFFSVSDTVICPNMKLGSFASLRDALRGTGGEHIVVEERTAKQALRSLEEMLRLGN